MPWRCVTSCTPFGTLGEKKWKITSTNYQEVSQNEVSSPLPIAVI